MNYKKISVILPGLLVSFLVAIISKVLAIWLSSIGAATISILLGIVLGNTFLNQKYLEKGTKFSESKLLEYSVVLLGFTVTFQTISKMGINGLIFVLIMMTIVIFSAYNIGRKLGFSENLSLMFAGGNAVCGSSAIGAIAPVIGADDEEKGQTITLVNLLGTVMMLTLPFMGMLLFKNSLLAKSALLGGTLQSVGQVVAGASLVSSSTVKYAMLFKITRIILLVFVVFLFGKKANKSKPQNKQNFRLPIPWYVLLFLIFCFLNSFVNLPNIFGETAHFLSGWFETIALAAIGLRLDFKKFIKEGPKFLLYGISIGIVQTVSALGLIFLLRIR